MPSSSHLLYPFWIILAIVSGLQPKNDKWSPLIFQTRKLNSVISPTINSQNLNPRRLSSKMLIMPSYHLEFHRVGYARECRPFWSPYKTSWILNVLLPSRLEACSEDHGIQTDIQPVWLHAAFLSLWCIQTSRVCWCNEKFRSTG